LLLAVPRYYVRGDGLAVRNRDYPDGRQHRDADGHPLAAGDLVVGDRRLDHEQDRGQPCHYALPVLADLHVPLLPACSQFPPDWENPLAVVRAGRALVAAAVPGPVPARVAARAGARAAPVLVGLLLGRVQQGGGAAQRAQGHLCTRSSTGQVCGPTMPSTSTLPHFCTALTAFSTVASNGPSTSPISDRKSTRLNSSHV